MSRIATWELLMANCLRADSMPSFVISRHEYAACEARDRLMASVARLNLGPRELELCGTEVVDGVRTFTMLADVPKLLADIAAAFPAFDPLSVRFSFWRECDPTRHLSGVVVLENGEQLLAKDAEEIRTMLADYRPERPGTPQRAIYDDFVRECFDLLVGTNTPQPALAGGVTGN